MTLQCVLLGWTLLVAPGHAADAGGDADRAEPRAPAVAAPYVSPATLQRGLASPLPARPPRRGDRWLAEDKWKHFFLSFFLTSVAASTARAAGLEPERSLLLGTGVAAGIGVGKELHDLGRGGRVDASLRDLAWDAAGLAAGAALLRQTY